MRGLYPNIQYQILPTDVRRIVWQTVGKIANEILLVKGSAPTVPFFTQVCDWVLVKMSRKPESTQGRGDGGWEIFD